MTYCHDRGENHEFDDGGASEGAIRVNAARHCLHCPMISLDYDDYDEEEVPMQFVVNIATDNDAFAEDSNAEVARILRVIADRLEASAEIAGSVNDVNGNRVCTFMYEEV